MFKAWVLPVQLLDRACPGGLQQDETRDERYSYLLQASAAEGICSLGKDLAPGHDARVAVVIVALP